MFLTRILAVMDWICGEGVILPLERFACGSRSGRDRGMNQQFLLPLRDEADVFNKTRKSVEKMVEERDYMYLYINPGCLCAVPRYTARCG